MRCWPRCKAKAVMVSRCCRWRWLSRVRWGSVGKSVRPCRPSHRVKPRSDRNSAHCPKIASVTISLTASDGVRPRREVGAGTWVLQKVPTSTDQRDQAGLGIEHGGGSAATREVRTPTVSPRDLSVIFAAGVPDKLETRGRSGPNLADHLFCTPVPRCRTWRRNVLPAAWAEQARCVVHPQGGRREQQGARCSGR